MRYAWITEPPFNFVGPTGLTGCDVELARQAFVRLGEPFEPIRTEFSRLLAGLEEERWDVTAGMFVTPERSSRAFFTAPIWALSDGLLVKSDDAAGITGYGSLAGGDGRLAVLEGQIQERTARDLGVPDAAIVVFRNYDEAARAVETGEVVAYASVERAHRAHIARRSDAALSCVPVPAAEKTSQPSAFACRSQAIRDALDGVLREMLGTSDHRSTLASFGLGPEEIVAPLS
jgi:polar amino acid transport system substrate-binding protein